MLKNVITWKKTGKIAESTTIPLSSVLPPNTHVVTSTYI